jgi:uncharacterized protein DUF1524
MFTRSGKAFVLGAATVIAAGTTVFLSSGSAGAVPPGVPDAATAQSELGQLTVAADGSMDGYSRDEFPHWHKVEGTCDTRETVLQRDGDGVDVGSDCYPTSGTWTSPYDGETWSKPSDVDIDHMVPLADAWRTGASEWTIDQREAFANDLDNPQLWAVTDNVNQSKSDQTPETWKPPLESDWCQYASAYTHVKFVYKLTVTDAEKTELTSMLGTC